MIELYFHTKCTVVLGHFYAPFFAILNFFTLDGPQSSHFQKAIFDAPPALPKRWWSQPNVLLVLEHFGDATGEMESMFTVSGVI